MDLKLQYSCLTAKNLFDMMDTSTLSFNAVTARKLGCYSKAILCARIFIYAFYLIIHDIIDNSICFMLPTNKRKAYIQIKVFKGEAFKELYRQGSFEGIDFLTSNFTGYSIYYRWQNSHGYREKPIYIDKKTKEEFYKKINQGKQYY